MSIQIGGPKAQDPNPAVMPEWRCTGCNKRFALISLDGRYIEAEYDATVIYGANKVVTECPTCKTYNVLKLKR